MLASIVGDGLNFVFSWLGHMIADGIASTMQGIGAMLTDVTRLQIGQSYWAIYGRVILVAAVLGVGIVGYKAVRGALSGRPGMPLVGVTQVGGGLIAAAILAAVLPLLQDALAATASFVAGGVTGVDAAGLATKLAGLVGVLGGATLATGGAILPILGGIVVLAALGVITALVVSVALVYIVLALCPILFVLGPKAMSKALEVLIVALSTPALITLMLAIGIALLADGPLTASGAITSTIVGLGIMLMGTVSPFVLIRLLPHPAIQEHVGRMQGAHSAAGGHASAMPEQARGAMGKLESGADWVGAKVGQKPPEGASQSAGRQTTGVATAVAAGVATGGVATAAGAAGAAGGAGAGATPMPGGMPGGGGTQPGGGLIPLPRLDSDSDSPPPTADPRRQAPPSREGGQ